MNCMYKAIVDKYKNVFKRNDSILALIHYGSSMTGDIWNESDVNFLCISSEFEKTIYIKEDNNVKIDFAFLTMDSINKKIDECSMDLLNDILLSGHIIFDKTEGKLSNTIHRINKNKNTILEKRIIREFSGFLKGVKASRKYFEKERYLDSYSQLLQCMIHWGKLIIYKEGLLPNKDMWQQVEEFNLGVYKLYEELLTSTEPLIKKIELMHLVYANMIFTYISYYTNSILCCIEKEDKYITKNQIICNTGLIGLDTEMDIILEELEKNKKIKSQKSSPLFFDNEGIYVYEKSYAICG